MVSRRHFLARLSAAMVPLPLRASALARGALHESAAGVSLSMPFGPPAPRARTKTPLDDVLLKVAPGLDEFPSEKHAQAIARVLEAWTGGLLHRPPDLQPFRESLAAELSAAVHAVHEERLRSSYGLEVSRRTFSDIYAANRGQFDEWMDFELGAFTDLASAESQVTGIHVRSEAPLRIETRIRYDLVGESREFFREERVGHWQIEWEGATPEGLRVHHWAALGESRVRAAGPVYVDIAAQVLGGSASHRDQLLRGTDYWRTVLDGACGIDVYGNNGVAVGDIDNDGFDDLYVCQPAGLPNRLYRNRGDGTFEDVTESAGVGVLDNTACALFADIDYNGYQDLLVVRSSGPLLFMNRKDGRFELQPEAFRFSRSPQGTFTGAALADYDRDGRLDVYFCVYSYYQGLDQYRFPVPYHDAQNGPPNFLFHNDGSGKFDDVTPSSGMDQNNNRFSFAWGWCDFNQDGWPDLYVANDFGRNNLYRNNGDGTFTEVAAEAGVGDIGAGMIVCWFDNGGKWDLYVSNMWSAAGQRVTMQDAFLKGAPETTRALYRKHASGNSLYHQDGDGHFLDAIRQPADGVEMGRWAWSSDACDFDHDGTSDLYVANGMISGLEPNDLSSFFWRQVVPRSPLTARTSRDYELGWNAINELIRSDGTWSGYERNVFFLNNRDGTFTEASRPSD